MPFVEYETVSQSNPLHILVVEPDIVPAEIDKFMTAVKEVGAAYVKESGCRRFSIAISQKDPNHVLLLEAWDNAAVSDAELTTDRWALEIDERAMGESLAVRGARRPRSSHSHHSEWCEGAGVAWQHASEPRAVTENNARHPVVVYPVEAE